MQDSRENSRVMVTLSNIGAGRSCVVRQISGGRGFVQRLAEMGILAGTELRVIRGHGPVVLEARGHRLVVGRGMVDHIFVEPLPRIKRLPRAESGCLQAPDGKQHTHRQRRPNRPRISLDLVKVNQ